MNGQYIASSCRTKKNTATELSTETSCVRCVRVSNPSGFRLQLKIAGFGDDWTYYADHPVYSPNNGSNVTWTFDPDDTLPRWGGMLIRAEAVYGHEDDFENVQVTSFSDEFGTSSNAPNFAPAPPQGLAVGSYNATTHEFTVTWTPETDPDITTLVRIALDPSVWSDTHSGIQPITQDAGTATFSWPNSTLPTVVAWNSEFANPASSNYVGVAGKVITVPEKPSDLGFTLLTRTIGVLHWRNNSNDETNFVIQRAKDSQFTHDVQILDTVGTDVTTYTDSSLDGDSTYWYQVRAVNAAGPSEWSQAVKVEHRHYIIAFLGLNGDPLHLDFPSEWVVSTWQTAADENGYLRPERTYRWEEDALAEEFLLDQIDKDDNSQITARESAAVSVHILGFSFGGTTAANVAYDLQHQEPVKDVDYAMNAPVRVKTLVTIDPRTKESEWDAIIPFLDLFLEGRLGPDRRGVPNPDKFKNYWEDTSKSVRVELFDMQTGEKRGVKYPPYWGWFPGDLYAGAVNVRVDPDHDLHFWETDLGTGHTIAGKIANDILPRDVSHLAIPWAVFERAVNDFDR